ncbi:MAG: hypothetical protein WCK78_04120 [Paludibacter sp.]
MKALEIKTRKGSREPKYIQNVDSATVFLRHSEDRITVISGETVNVEVYHNGNCVFVGDKSEFYEKLKNK